MRLFPTRPLYLALGLLAAAPAAAAAAPTSTTVPISSPGAAVAKSPDGSMWVAQPTDPGRVAQIKPSGDVTEYIGGVTDSFPANRKPTGMAVTPDGKAWFLIEGLLDDWASITPSTGKVQRHELLLDRPTGIVAGADGKLWMTIDPDHPSRSEAIASYDPATNQAIGYTANFTSQSSLRALTAGGDGAFWFVEGSTGLVGRMTATGGYSYTSTPIAPAALAAGLDGSMWFGGGPKLGVIAGNYSLVPSAPTALALGPDGAMWSATTGGVLRATADGSATTHDAGLPEAAVGKGIAAGPDGRMWLTLDRAPYLVRITVPPRLTKIEGSATSATTAELTADVRPNGILTSVRVDRQDANGDWVSAGETVVGDGTEIVNVRLNVPGLTPGAENALRLVAVNDAGTQQLSKVITTEALPPEPTTPEPTTPEPTTPEPTTPEPTTPEPTTPEPTTPEPTTPEPTTPDQTDPEPTTPDDAPISDTKDPGPAAPEVPVAMPAPVQGTTVVLQPERGTVRFRVPGSSVYNDLTSATSLPTGSVIDTTRGAVQLSSQIGSKTQDGEFSGGEIRVRQNRKTGMTQIVLVAELDCSTTANRSTRAKKAKKKRRHVWGKDRGGKFETHGRDSVATVRGTKWLTTDTCKSTVVKVYEGAVSVQAKAKNKKRGKAVLVKAGGRHVTSKKS